jgi:hypothetical protein
VGMACEPAVGASGLSCTELELSCVSRPGCLLISSASEVRGVSRVDASVGGVDERYGLDVGAA